MMYSKKIFPSVIVSILILSAACRKEAVEQTKLSASTASSLTGSDSVLLALKISNNIGSYSARGSQTVYNGQANQQGDNIKLILDFFITKKLLPTADGKHLSLPYSYGKYVSKGWKYIISYDYKNNKIILEPNDVMASEIVPGSFEALYADYSVAAKAFTFQTRFTALEDNGNESEVIEPLVKVQ